MIFNIFLIVAIIVLYLVTHLGNKDKGIKDKTFLTLSFLLLFIIVGMREFTIGNDTFSYIKFYKQCSIYKWGILKINKYYETGYVVLNVLLTYLSSNSRFFLLVMSLIFNFSVFRFVKKNSKEYLISILMYIGFLYFYQSMSMMRQFLALSIILVSFDFVKQNKFLKYLLCVIIASLFHSSAWIALLIYPLSKIKYNKRNIILIFLFSFIISLWLNFLFPLVSPLFNRENSYLSMIGNAKLGNLLSSIIFFIMFLFSSFIIKKGNKEKYGFYLFLLLVASMLNVISINMAVLSRISQYFTILSICIFPNIIKDNIKKIRISLYIFIVIFLLIYSSTIIYLRPEWNSAYNYKSCIFKNKNYICNIE